MSSHPDADAFIRKYLRTPADATARLVFADWLDETDRPRNRTWAAFIRLKVEAGRLDPADPARADLEARAGRYAPKVRARLTIPAALFVGHPRSFLELLPPANVAVWIGSFRPPAAVVGRVPEAVARAYRLLPLDDSAAGLIVAHPDPADARLLQTLRNILHPSVVVVGAAEHDITRAVEDVYSGGRRRGGPAEAPIVPAPPLDYAGDPGEFLDRVLAECARRRADVLTFVPTGDRVRVIARASGETPELAQLPRGGWDEQLFPEVRRRGEAAGTEFTVEVVRNGNERAVRIWL